MKGTIAGNLDFEQKTTKPEVLRRLMGCDGLHPRGGNTDFREVEQEANPEHGEAVPVAIAKCGMENHLSFPTVGFGHLGVHAEVSIYRNRMGLLPW